MDSLTPIQHLEQFFEGLPVSERDQILYDFLMFTPDIANQKTLFIPENFRKHGYDVFKAWLNNHNDYDLAMASRVLIARTLIDFCAFRGKKTSRDFEDDVEVHENIIETARQEGDLDLVKAVEQMRDKLTATEITWLMTYQNWRSLCENELSDEAIDQWLENNRIKNKNDLFG